ncbi:hypothetical protein P3601_25670, partial [Vibrio parahaemolyticus]|uniref:hypothetical protein n=1 Tax=Vibrio parahaemolyticus TaxID=670 RepID=UPI001BB02245
TLLQKQDPDRIADSAGLRCIQSTVRSENRVNFALACGEYGLVKTVYVGSNTDTNGAFSKFAKHKTQYVIHARKVDVVV